MTAALVLDPPNRVQKSITTDFGAIGDGVERYDGTISAGSTNLTVSGGIPFRPSDVGKSICVGKAANGGQANLVTKISAYVSATAVTLAAAASTSVSNACVVYGTDNSAALSAAWASMTVSPGTQVRVPDGYYVDAGVWPNTSATTGSPSNSRYPCPMVAPNVSPIHMGFEGVSNASYNSPSVTLNGVGSPSLLMGGIICVISAPTGGSAPSIFGANYYTPGVSTAVHVTLDKITVRQVPTSLGPLVSAVNLDGAGGMDSQYLRVDTCEPNYPTFTAPTITGAYGIRMPGNNVSFGKGHLLGCIAQGYYNNIWLGEHAVADDCISCFCVNAYVIGGSYHPQEHGMLQAFLCTNALVADPNGGQPAEFHIAHLDLESCTNIVNDPGSIMRGSIRAYTNVVANVGQSYGVAHVGGRNVSIRNWRGGTQTFLASMQIPASGQPVADSGQAFRGGTGNPFAAFAGSGSTLPGAGVTSTSTGQSTSFAESNVYDGVTRAVLQASPTASRTNIGFAFQGVDATHWLGVRLRNDAGATGIQIIKQNGAGDTNTTVLATVPFTPAAGVAHDLAVRYVAGLVRVMVDGTQLPGGFITISGADRSSCEGTLRGLESYVGPSNDDGGSRLLDFAADGLAA